MRINVDNGSRKYAEVNEDIILTTCSTAMSMPASGQLCRSPTVDPMSPIISLTKAHLCSSDLDISILYCSLLLEASDTAPPLNAPRKRHRASSIPSSTQKLYYLPSYQILRSSSSNIQPHPYAAPAAGNSFGQHFSFVQTF